MSDFRPNKKRNINREDSFNDNRNNNTGYINPDQHLLQRTLSALPNKTVDEARSLNDNLSSIGMRTRQSVSVGYNRGEDKTKLFEEQRKQMPNLPKVLDNSQFTLPSYKRTLPPDDFEPTEYRRVQTDIPGGFNQFQYQQQQQIHQQYLQQQLQYQQNNQEYQSQNRPTFQRPNMNINTGMLLNHTRSEFPQQQQPQFYTSGIPGLEYNRTNSSIYEKEIDLERRLSEIDENKDKIEQIENAINSNIDDMEF